MGTVVQVTFSLPGFSTASQAGEGQAHLFSTRQLDNLRLALSVRHSNTGKPKVDQQELVRQIDQQLLALVEEGSFTMIVKDALESGKSDDELQRAMRQHAASLIVNHKLLERLAVLSLHPRPDIQLKSISALISYVLPRLQSTEVVMKQDHEDEKFQQEMMNKMEQIRVDMAKARLIDYGPTTEAEVMNDAPYTKH